MTRLSQSLVVSSVMLLWGVPAHAQETTPPTPEAQTLSPSEAAAARLLAFIAAVDEDAIIQGNTASFNVDGLQLQMVFDSTADRMRVMIPIAASYDLSDEQLERLMQANFDSALDARYAIAQGAVWSVFLHRLSSLPTEDFASGIAQTVSLVRTYGTTFQSGAAVFGGGDSAEEHQKLVDELLRRGDPI